MSKFCLCLCHRDKNIIHIIPCCYIKVEDSKVKSERLKGKS